MIKKINFFITVIPLLILSACGAKDKDIVVDMNETENIEFEKSEELENYFDIEIASLPITPICVDFYCVNDDKIYYAVDYYEILTDQTGLTGNIQFEDKYNTEIRMYDFQTQNDVVLYKYNEARCVSIFDIRANSNRIVWVETTDTGWNMKTMVLGGESSPEIIVSGKKEEGYSAVVPKVTEEKVYWYNSGNEGTNQVSLFSYDFSDKKIQCEEDMLSLASPYEDFSLIGNVGTMLRQSEDEKINNLILLKNMNNQKENRINISGCVGKPIANEKICVWMEGYDSRNNLYVYTFDGKKAGRIDMSPAYAFSYGIVEGYVFINQWQDSQYGTEGLYCFDTENGKYQKINLPCKAGTVLLTIFEESENSIYLSSEGNDTMQIICIKYGKD
jgi:hypothetical protein